jgi:hypothetical protein
VQHISGRIALVPDSALGSCMYGGTLFSCCTVGRRSLEYLEAIVLRNQLGIYSGQVIIRQDSVVT